MVGYIRCNVSPDIPNPLRCRKCQRYGHHEVRYRRREVCEHCEREGHNDADSCDIAGKQCVNCKGNHAASSRDCLSWKKEREVLRVKYTRNSSFPDARKAVESNDPAALSYTSKTKSKTQRHQITVNDAKVQAYFDKPALGAAVPPLIDERKDRILFGLASRFKSGRVASKSTSPLQCSINPKSKARNQRKTTSDVLAAQVSAGCKLLSIYNIDMNALRHVQDAVLLKFGLKKSGFQRLQSTGDCHSYQTTISFADKLAGLWDTELCSWQHCLAVNMGVLKKNEAKHDEMVDICQFLNKYVPSSAGANSGPVKILSGADYLTFERHKQAQMSHRDQDTPYNRLEGLVPKMEEFHNQAELLEVMWHMLYSPASSRDIGTLYAARNITDSRNVSADPSGNFYASSAMAEKFTDAYLVAGALKYFGMNSISTAPTKNIYEGPMGDTSEMNKYLLHHANSFLKHYLDLEISGIPDYGPQSNDYVCRYCGKKYTQGQGLRKHEHKIHDHPDPRFETNSEPTTSISTQDEDHILNYTKRVLLIGLLQRNHNDAISMGDCAHMMLVNQYLCLLYKLSGCPKYAFGILETICQSKILLSPRLAHRLVWNRTVNHRRKIDSNLPNDLDLEHCNKVFKDEAHSFRGVFTDKTISRVSRSALATHFIVKNFDKETETHSPSGVHKKADLAQDVNVIVMQLLQQNVYDNIHGRRHDAFPEIKSNPFSTLDMDAVRDWISQSLRKFSAKHFYPTPD
ncbi:uncharacterized protein LOC117340625 [Pecten maximus]|uniref:uncharacterized protein LOC117340625 n=1 Tax=Pecten maximus TaxID=6579 RepID=UPI001457F845|nr:uncharacterized protein LOC117340625 [Pecten maximus]